MSEAALPGVPSPWAWRRRLRRARRKHHGRPWGEVFTDLYMLLWLVAVYGTALVSVIRRHVAAAASAPAGPAEQWWIGIALLLAGAGLAWRGLQAVGPLMATPAEQSWGVSTPLDRRGLLLTRFVAFVLGGAAVGAVFAFIVAFLALHGPAPLRVALAGGLWGAALVALCVVAQSTDAGRAGRGWPRMLGVLTLTAAIVLVAAVVGADSVGLQLTRPERAWAGGMSLAGIPLALGGLVAAFRMLPRLDLAALSAGTQVAAATLTATVWLDPSVLTGIMEVRRWRRVGRVRSRHFRPLGGRVGVLLQAELRRQMRRPGALAVWAVLALTQYAVAVVAPALAVVSRVLLAYGAAGRLAAGLRILDGSPGLRRSLGGNELQLRLTHVVLPALGTALWWVLTGPTAGRPPGVLDAVLVAGIVGAAYRGATRPPLSYGGAAMETPFGLFPVEMVQQMARGPDLLAAIVLIAWLAGG